MTGGNWSPALLLIAAALAIAVAPARFRFAATFGLLVSAATAGLIAYPPAWQPVMLAGAWMSIIITALATYRRPDRSRVPSLALAINAGVWAGAVTASFGSAQDLLRILPLILLVLPAGWIVARGASIALKVVASWLVAIAVLIAVLPIVTTPGYVQDHMQ